MSIYDINPNYIIEINIKDDILEILLHISNIINIIINKKKNILIVDYMDIDYIKINKIQIFFNNNSKLQIKFEKNNIFLYIDNILEYIIKNQKIIQNISYINVKNANVIFYKDTVNLYNNLIIEKNKIDNSLIEELLSTIY